MDDYDFGFRKYTLGTKLDFSNIRYNIINYFEYGISEPEDGFAWFSENEALLTFDFDCDEEIILGKFDLSCIFQDSQKVSIYVNDILVFNNVVTNTNELKFVFARPKDRKTTIRLVFPDAKSPYDLGLSDDKRLLSLSAKSLVFEKFSPNAISKNEEILFLKSNCNFDKYEIFGFSDAEDVGAWTNDYILAFAVHFDKNQRGLVICNVNLAAIFNNKQKVKIYVNGLKVFDKEVENFNDISFEFLIPKLGDALFNIELEDAMSPSMLGYAQDLRILGLMFKSISFLTAKFLEYKLGTNLIATKSDFSLNPYVFKGLLFAENDYAWTQGKQFLFGAKINNTKNVKKATCEIYLKGVFNGSQTVIISDLFNEVFYGVIDNSTSKIKFDTSVNESGEVAFELYLPNAISPCELDSQDNDKRVLSLKIEKIVLK